MVYIAMAVVPHGLVLTYEAATIPIQEYLRLYLSLHCLAKSLLIPVFPHLTLEESVVVGTKLR